ncbi:MAG: hypothetical protein U1E87_09140 [Alphaproteobacteria bacterium]
MDSQSLRGQGQRRQSIINAVICTIDVPNIDDFVTKAVKLGAAVALPKMAVPGVGSASGRECRRRKTDAAFQFIMAAQLWAIHFSVPSNPSKVFGLAQTVDGRDNDPAMTR